MTTHAMKSADRPRQRGGAWSAGVWRVADPKITLASVASMIVGAAAAGFDGPMHWGWLAVTVLGVFFVEAAKNASGDIFDWDSGADQAITEDERSPFSGGKRVIVDGLLNRRQTAVVAGAFYLAAIAAGFAIVLAREPAVIWLGMLGVGLAFFYHAPPFALAYRGLGELAVAIAYGPVIAAGTYLVQRGDIGANVLLASVPVGLAVGAFLWVNEFPDARADAEANKRTLVVRLGRPKAARAYRLIVIATYLAVAMLPVFGLPAAVWLGFAGLPFAAKATIRLCAGPEDMDEIVPAQGMTLLAFVVLSVGLGAGFALAAMI